MADDQGNKEEEKFEFTAAGEALYFSLDQAVLKARRLAREGEQHYLQRLRWDEIVWTESNSETREDSYRVVLKFQRPARGSSEEQTGQEEFLFDLTGGVLDRQVLVWPDVGDDTSVPTPRPTLPNPSITIEPSSAAVHDIIVITGTNFGPLASVTTLTIGNADVTPSPAPRSSRTGNLTATAIIPLMNPGTYVVVMQTGTNFSATATITII